MIDILNDALVTVAFTVGLAIAVSISIVASAALWQRHERTVGVREVEQHLAAVAAEHNRAAAS